MIIGVGQEFITILVAKYADDGTTTGRILTEDGDYITTEDGSRFIVEYTGEETTAEAPSVIAVSEVDVVISVVESNPVMAINESLVVVSTPQEIKVLSVSLGSGGGGTSSSSETLTLVEQGVEPDDPAEGGSILWRATNGDIMAKSTEGGVTKTATIFPYSILT